MQVDDGDVAPPVAPRALPRVDGQAARAEEGAWAGDAKRSDAVREVAGELHGHGAAIAEADGVDAVSVDGEIVDQHVE